MRPDPVRLQLGSYPIALEIATRFSDLDSLDHVNNVSYADLFQESRMRFNMKVRELEEVEGFREEGRFVLVASNFTYLHESQYPEPVTVGVGVTRLGATSYSLGCGMFQRDRCVAVNDTTVVNAVGGSSLPLPDSTRVLLSRFRIRVTQ